MQESTPGMVSAIGDVLLQDCLEMKELGEDLEGLPLGAREIPGPLLQRQVTDRHRDCSNGDRI